jgi:hypothetical protein
MLVHLDVVENYLVGDTDDYSVIEFLLVGSFDVVGSNFVVCSTFVVDCLSDGLLGYEDLPYGYRYYRIKNLLISVKTIKIQKVLVTQEHLIWSN